MSEDVEFIDAESQYVTNQANNYKDIIMNHLSKISGLATKEFVAGYWQKKPFRSGDSVMFTEVYKEDTRDAYVNAVDFLYDMLLPYVIKEDCKNNKEIDKIIQEITDTKEKIEDKEAWKNNRLRLRRKLFQELSILLNEKRYFEGVTISD